MRLQQRLERHETLFGVLAAVSAFAGWGEGPVLGPTEEFFDANDGFGYGVVGDV